MKRKLDENDVPTPVEPADEALPSEATFESFGLDPRLLQAIAEAEYKKPTVVQSQAIPVVLHGGDVVARAHTGSGKTAAYVLPILQSILRQKQANPKLRAVLALILVPTKELARQVYDVVTQLTSRCNKHARVINLSQKSGDAVIRALLEECPEVVVGTPARAMAHVRSEALKLDSLLHLVVDEADLILSYGHEEDLNDLARSLPPSVQKTLMSATASTELESLEKLLCHDPARIQVEATKEEAERISQYVVSCGEQDKFLYLYAIYKLNLVKGKSLIFVHDIDRCYRLKLYLEQFGVRSCVLNSELPVNSRIHTVEEFNKNAYRIIIAADEQEALGNEDGAADAKEDPAQASKAKRASGRPQKRRARDREYGVSRGIDFKAVSLVLNFDLPSSATSYTHRIGRTARAGQSGTAISFAVPAAEVGKHKPTSVAAAAHDDVVLCAIEAAQREQGRVLQAWQFAEDVRAFEYRCADALRCVTKVAVREARTRELRQELLNSDKLQRHFRENPDELHHLRHDAETRALRVQHHLRHVPDYLMPGGGGSDSKADLGFVGPGRVGQSAADRKRLRESRARQKGRRVVRDRAGRKDPLRTFNASGRGKK